MKLRTGIAPGNIDTALSRIESGRIGGGHLAGIFADAVAVAPCLEGRAAIDWLVEQPLDVLQPAPKDALPFMLVRHNHNASLTEPPYSSRTASLFRCSSLKLKLLDGGGFSSALVGGFHGAQGLRPPAQERHAPGAHAGGELRGSVFAGAAGWHAPKIGRRVRGVESLFDAPLTHLALACEPGGTGTFA
jgi:hypothetical protein